MVKMIRIMMKWTKINKKENKKKVELRKRRKALPTTHTRTIITTMTPKQEGSAQSWRSIVKRVGDIKGC